MRTLQKWAFFFCFTQLGKRKNMGKKRIFMPKAFAVSPFFVNFVPSMRVHVLNNKYFAHPQGHGFC